MLYYLANVVNRHCEFRTAINREGELGIYDELIPSYTVFHKETETFSDLWTANRQSLEDFCLAYEEDMCLYGKRFEMTGKPNIPENVFSVSMIQWVTFEGFNLNLQRGFDYLLPIFTIGRYYQEDNCNQGSSRTLLPLAIQVHHAVCDGFHVCRFVNELQEMINR